jgi:hypothetical protein
MLSECAHRSNRQRGNERIFLPCSTCMHEDDTRSISLATISTVLCENEFLTHLSNTVHISYERACQLASKSTTLRKPTMTKEHLSQLWGISFTASSPTIHVCLNAEGDQGGCTLNSTSLCSKAGSTALQSAWV